MDRSIQIKAISSDPRLTVLRLLKDPQKNFGHQQSADPAEFGVCMTLIAHALEIAQPTASRHLDILKQAGFITARRHLKWSYCKRNEAEIMEFLSWLGDEISPHA
ncbi:ArsR/SmtB family transcription factor [Pseudovibrio axinellae]|nr:ArsR family transcriptional regulator [Pseudovibrio axinellae]